MMEKWLPGLKKLPVVLRHGYVLLAVIISFVLFNAENLSMAAQDIAGLFGFGGMILAVPTTALLYSFIRGSVEEKLRKKKLPTSTAYYMDDVQHLYKKPPERTPLTAEELLALDIPSIDEVNEVKSVEEEIAEAIAEK